MKSITIFLLLSAFSIFISAQNNAKEDPAKKIEEATPKQLPQSPVVTKLKSDADDDGLKGKVKTVSKSEEDLSGTWVFKGIKKASETFYDEKGNRIKYIYYDYRGNPSDITVYGYIDGMRVSKSGYIVYPYNPPPMLVPDEGKPNSEKPVDNRFDSRYDYKYDKGRLIESVIYRNNRELLNKTVYAYDGNKLEKTWFNEKGKLYSKVIDLLDDKSNIIEHTFVYVTSDKPDSKTFYTYDSFDAQGNWTKRTISNDNSGAKQPRYTEYRTITYYP